MPANPGHGAQWPPRSPHEALLGTPSGRRRLRELADRTSPSPSPSKTSRRPNDLQFEQADDDCDEDEELLRLQLEAIEAKLKLKRLQSAKAKKAAGSQDLNSRSESAPISDLGSPRKGRQRNEELNSGAPARSQSQGDIQVPASPVRRAQTAQEQMSPSRIRLGIDKGLQGKDVSLKRAPSLRKVQGSRNDSNGGYLRRTHTPSSADDDYTSQSRPSSFSERLAAARTDESSRQERQERIRRMRSTAFDIDTKEMERFKDSATEIPEAPVEPEEFSREEVVSARRGGRAKESPTLQDSAPNSSSLAPSALPGAEKSANQALKPGKKKLAPSDVPEAEASAFEPYSGLHLSKRIIPHSTLARNLAGKKTFLLPDILKHVKAPDFELPDVEQDIVVFAILASKSDPRSHQNNSNLREKKPSGENARKYMVLKLVDLKWELELFLFNSGFERYWKLVPGTVVAILNPTIMPPPPGSTDTGRFSLVINSGEDTILEIGTARDLAYCKSVKKDGQQCRSWVNKKRTEFCEFHMNNVLNKKRQARQDINAFNTGLGPRRRRGSDEFMYGKRRNNSYHLYDWKGDGEGNGKGKGQANDKSRSTSGEYDRSTQSHFFVNKASAASILDSEVLPGQVADRVERSEQLRRRLAHEEKERDIMKKLGSLGSGAGKEYMQSGHQQRTSGASNLPSGSQGSQDRPAPLDAQSLGLLRGKGDQQPAIHLSPIKRKRSAPNDAAPSASQSDTKRSALGWGGSLKDKLAKMKEGQTFHSNSSSSSSSNTAKQDADGGGTMMRQLQLGPGGSIKSFTSTAAAAEQPVRKKTRFMTDKGIREAGRESLGGEKAESKKVGGGRTVFLGGDDDGDDDDDELVILR